MANLPGDSIQIAREYMDSLLVESRIIGAVRPSSRFEFLGESFDTPIMTAALSHIDLVGMAEGAVKAGAAVSIGMGDNDTLGEVINTGAKVMKIIKPYENHDEIYSRIKYAEENGAYGVRDKIKEMTDQLLAMMYRTSSADIRHIDPSVIWEK